MQKHFVCFFLLAFVVLLASTANGFAAEGGTASGEASEDEEIEFMLEGEGLVFEADSSKSGIRGETGRSIAVSGDALRQTAEISVFEDAMSSIKTLPGVGYAGPLDAKPSIRGGEPGGLTAVFDGFYVDNPYHWDGLISIFDPEFVESAKLSHGVFSARYGHTVSALLEVESKKANPSTIEADGGFSISNLKARVSVPFNKTKKNGGIHIAGNGMWLQPVVLGAKKVTGVVDFIQVAPYMLNTILSLNYRLSDPLELHLSGFIGLDGMANKMGEGFFEFKDVQGFVTAGLLWNPTNKMLFQSRLGAGFLSNGFTSDYDSAPVTNRVFEGKTGTYQARFDFDWDLGRNLLLSVGTEELFSTYAETYSFKERDRFDVANKLSFLSAWTTLEYAGKKLGGELGVRLDHLYYIGEDFSIKTLPTVSPRFNIDYKIIDRNRVGTKKIDALLLTAGTGLFSGLTHESSYNIDNIHYLQKENCVNDYELKQTRSWTSIAGVRLDFLKTYSGTVEFYYKHLFNRFYMTYNGSRNVPANASVFFDGKGQTIGFDVILQKVNGKIFDGWLSYSFNSTRYRDASGADWYYPKFHRFHNINLVANFYLTERAAITTRTGYATGVFRNGKRERGAASLDVKFSYRWQKTESRVRGEFYVAIGNILSVLYIDRFNENLKGISDGDMTYQLPIPIPSLGFKISY